MRFESTVALFALGALASASDSEPGRNLMTPAHPQFMQLYTVDHEICSRAVDRLLYQNFDPNVSLREHSKANPWTDTTFPFPTSIFWEDMRPRDYRDS